jgi:hypothetical protein
MKKSFIIDVYGHLVCVCGSVMDVFSSAAICPVCEKEIDIVNGGK